MPKKKATELEPVREDEDGESEFDPKKSFTSSVRPNLALPLAAVLKDRPATSAGSTKEGGLETARTMREARAARNLPPAEKDARERSLQKLMQLPLDERLRLYKRVNAAKKVMAARVVGELKDPSVGQPKTPRELEDHISVVANRVLREVLEAERAEEMLVAAIREKAHASAPTPASAKASTSTPASIVPSKKASLGIFGKVLR